MNLYEKIIDNFIEHFNKLKDSIFKIEDVFIEANEEDLTVILDLYKTFTESSTFYNEEELEELSNYIVPKKVSEFYSNYNPKNNILVHGGIYLFGLNSIKEYNASAFPDKFLIKYGILVIGNTISGNLICLDINSINNDDCPVIALDKSIIYLSDDEEKPELVAREITDEEIQMLENGLISEEELREWLTYQGLIKYSLKLSDTFTEFLLELSELDERLEDIDSLF